MTGTEIIIFLIAAGVSFWAGKWYGILMSGDQVHEAHGLFKETVKRQEAIKDLKARAAEVVLEHQLEYFRAGAVWLLQTMVDDENVVAKGMQVIDDQCRAENFEARISL